MSHCNTCKFYSRNPYLPCAVNPIAFGGSDCLDWEAGPSESLDRIMVSITLRAGEAAFPEQGFSEALERSTLKALAQERFRQELLEARLPQRVWSGGFPPLNSDGNRSHMNRQAIQALLLEITDSDARTTILLLLIGAAIAALLLS